VIAMVASLWKDIAPYITKIVPALFLMEERCWMRDKMDIISDKDISLLISQTENNLC